MKGARGVIINITGGPDFSLAEVSEAARIIQEAAHEDANIIFGAVVDPEMDGRVQDHGHRHRLRPAGRAVGAARQPDAGRPAALQRVAAGGAARRGRRRRARISISRRPMVELPMASGQSSATSADWTDGGLSAPIGLDDRVAARRAGVPAPPGRLTAGLSRGHAAAAHQAVAEPAWYTA